MYVNEYLPAHAFHRVVVLSALAAHKMSLQTVRLGELNSGDCCDDDSTAAMIMMKIMMRKTRLMAMAA